MITKHNSSSQNIFKLPTILKTYIIRRRIKKECKRKQILRVVQKEKWIKYWKIIRNMHKKMIDMNLITNQLNLLTNFSQVRLL